MNAFVYKSGPTIKSGDVRQVHEKKIGGLRDESLNATQRAVQKALHVRNSHCFKVAPQKDHIGTPKKSRYHAVARFCEREALATTLPACLSRQVS